MNASTKARSLLALLAQVLLAFGIGPSLATSLAAAEGKEEKPLLYPPDAGSRKARYAVPEDDLYKSPVGAEFSPDGSVLYVTCEDSNELVAVDPRGGKVLSRTPVGRSPFGVAVAPDGKRLYVSNRKDGTVSVLQAGARPEDLKAAATFKAGDNPHGLITDVKGEVLYVANLNVDDVSLIETSTGKELKRLKTGRSPFELSRSRDGKRIYISSLLSVPVPFRTPSKIEITVIDAVKRYVVERRLLPSTVIAQGITVTPDDRFVVVALELPKNLVPEAQILQGGMVTHGFAVLETGIGGRSAFLLVDEPQRYFADACAVRFSPDGKRLYVTSSGVDTVTVIDWTKVTEILKLAGGKIGVPDEEIRRLARHLGISSEYVLARIETGANPKGTVLSPDGSLLCVADRLSDDVSAIDAVNLAIRGKVDLGGPKVVTRLRRGAQLFNHARVSFQRQLSCTTCHPENHLDGLSYDIGLDGMGLNIVDNRTMRGIAATGPFKWNGKNPTIARQEGPRAGMLFFRSHGYEDEDNECVVEFIESLPLLENRFRPERKYNEFQRRGKVLFERAIATDGRYIPVGNRCITCHPAPYYTDAMRHDVGSKASHDLDGEFDTPQLNNIYLQAPYMHDGRCYTLEEIWTVFNPDDTHGQTNDMTKEMLNDLIEYLKTL
jgi:YVTN family beta-propeller protein